MLTSRGAMLRRAGISLAAAALLVALASGHAKAAAEAAPRVPMVSLNNGLEMPMLSLGIWQLSDEEVEAVVPLALSMGYNFLDASIFYGVPENGGRPNQPALGRALKGVLRESYYVLSKIDPSYLDSTEYGEITPAYTPETAYYRTLEQGARNLADLGFDYVDVMLTHWSVASCDTMRETWRAMETMQRLGWAKSVGVSNYCPATLQCILATATITPAVNQVKVHAGMEANVAPLREFCEPRGIVVQAYSPLGGGGKHHTNELISGELVSSIGAAHGRSGAQVALRYLVQHGIPLSTKSTKEKHLQEALEIFDFTLSDAEMSRLDAYTSAPAETYSFTCDCAAAHTCGAHGGGFSSPYA